MPDLDPALAALHTNQRLFAAELIRRGASVKVVDASVELLEVSYGGRSEYVLDRAGKAVAYLPSSLASDKHLSKHVLRQRGIRTPEGELFDDSRVEEALDYGDSLGYPLVAKPNVGSHGDGVRSGISCRAELAAAIESLLSSTGKRHFVVERHIPGDEFRIFATSKGAHAVLLREPAHVVGDGRRSIEALARAETERRREAKARDGGALCPIALDATAQAHLARQGLDFESIPEKGRKVQLRLSSNLAQGGLSRDMTDLAHPDAIAVARAALAAFDGLPSLGIDVIVPDIRAPLGPQNPYAIIEVNANPGLAMHHMPAEGPPRDVASMLADAMFPDLPSPGPARGGAAP